MTREQARREIDSLDFYLQNHTDDYGEEIHTVMMMAKDALSRSEIPNTCGDAISRQAVDDAIYDYSRSCDVNYQQIMEYIEKIPSVTPQQKMGHSFPEGATNKDIFKVIFGYEPATDSVVCNKEDWCGASEPCKYCTSNSNSIGREENWWNAEYKEPKTESEGKK